MRKKIIAGWLILACLFSRALAEGVNVRIVSSFSGSDQAAGAYVDILHAYEEATGNTVSDSSSPSDETWKASVLNDFAAGNEPDVLFFFAAGADSAPLLSRVVPISEINAAYPDLSLPENPVLREADGLIYAVPVRSYWEAMYVNTDLLEKFGLDLPSDWDSFSRAVSRFRQEGIVPVSVSLTDIPHYLAEFAILACATPEEQQARPRSLEEVPASWFDAMRLIREMNQMGAFSDDVNSTSESASTRLFLSKQAAMQFDGSWLAASLPQESMDTTRVQTMPLRWGEGASEGFIGGVSMGFYLTRKAWNSPRRDAAVALLATLTSAENMHRLSNRELTGQLLSSEDTLERSGLMLSPLQDDMNKEAREVWLLECIPALAEGTMTAEECWARVMSLSPFGK